MLLLTNLNNQHFQKKSTTPARAQANGNCSESSIFYFEGEHKPDKISILCVPRETHPTQSSTIQNKRLCLQHHPQNRAMDGETALPGMQNRTSDMM